MGRTQQFYLLVGLVEDVPRQFLSVEHLAHALRADLQLFSQHDSQQDRVAGVLEQVLHAADVDVLHSLRGEEGVDVLVEEVLDAGGSSRGPLHEFHAVVEAVLAVAVHHGQRVGDEEPDLVGREAVVLLFFEVILYLLNVLLVAVYQDRHLRLVVRVLTDPLENQV